MPSGRSKAPCRYDPFRLRLSNTVNRNLARLLAISAAIFAVAAMRLLPHPPNFAPIGAMALFSGAYFRRSWLAFAIPLTALLLSDAVIGFYSHMEVVYFSFAFVVVLGWLSLGRISPVRVGAAAVTSSLLFYVTTNLGEWLYSGIYSHSLDGLVACYVAAVPFFQNTLAGDLFYSVILFGGFALLQHGVPGLREPSELRPSH